MLNIHDNFNCQWQFRINLEFLFLVLILAGASFARHIIDTCVDCSVLLSSYWYIVTVEFIFYAAAIFQIKSTRWFQCNVLIEFRTITEIVDFHWISYNNDLRKLKLSLSLFFFSRNAFLHLCVFFFAYASQIGIWLCVFDGVEVHCVERRRLAESNIGKNALAQATVSSGTFNSVRESSTQ